MEFMDIQNSNIRQELFDQITSFLIIGCFRYDPEIRIFLKKLANSGAYNNMVIGKQNTNNS